MPDHIINVTELNFEYEVLSFSQNKSVVVDFWATWCKPCRILGPLLEKLALESQGAFRLARVDVDENPNLAMQYRIHSIPTVKAFSGREIVGEFVDAQPEERVREFLRKILPPNRMNLALEKAESLLSEHHWQEAEKVLLEVLDGNPAHPAALLGYIKCCLALDRPDEGLSLLKKFPESRQYVQAQNLIASAVIMNDHKLGKLIVDTDLDAAFASSINLARKGNLLAAMDGLLDILRQDKHYRSGTVRQIFLGLMELYGTDSQQIRQYRSELAAVLF